MKQIIPKVFMVGASEIRLEDMGNFFEEMEVPQWNTDAKDACSLITEVAGKLCYRSFSTDLNKNLTKVGTRSNEEYIQKGLIATKHGSVLEHTSVNFIFTDISRILTHELVRHRVGTAFSQESGRYVRTDCIGMYIPEIIQKNQDLLIEFVNTVEMIEERYKLLERVSGIEQAKDFDWKKQMTSALRRILPNGQANSIFFTSNHRELRHVIELRTSRHAEEEIRLVFLKVFHLVREAFPALYMDGKLSAELYHGFPEVTF